MKLVPRNYYLDDLLDSFLSTEDDNKMKCDIYEKDGKYQRSFYLGDIKEDEIEAKFDNGILNIVVPKIDKEATKKYIEVK